MNNVLGVQMYTVREFTTNLEDFTATAKKIADIGYTAVQVSCIGPIANEDVYNVCQDNGLTIAGTHIGWGDFCDKTDEVIEKHKAYHCPNSAVGCLPAEYYTSGLDGVKKFLDELGPVLEKLTAADITFSFHNHNQEFLRFDGKAWLEWLYEMGPEELLPEIDTYWIQAGGANPASWIRKFPNRQPLLHFKDMSINFGPDIREQRLAAIGEGNLDWDDIIAAAKEANARWYLVEQDNCYGRDPFDCLKSSYDFLTSKGLK